MICG
jgi:hypothetical protein